MYARQNSDSRPQKNINIPLNYSGNAFFRSHETGAAPPPLEPSEEINTEGSREGAEVKTSGLPVFCEKEGKDSSGLFGLLGGGSRGIGFEELLILGLIFLISQNDSRDDLSLLLLLLLFVK